MDMNDESRLLATVWDAMSSFVPASDKTEAARVLVETLMELGYEADDLMDAEGEDSYLDKALSGLEDEDDEYSDEDDY